ncbi:MAG: hypothetical protein ABIR52_02115, partial [Casimicrobiaceae bacterium]
RDVAANASPARGGWFELGLRFFAAGAMIALILAGWVALPQLRMIAAIAFVQALLGLAICAWGLRTQRPARWNALSGRLGVGRPRNSPGDLLGVTAVHPNAG